MSEISERPRLLLVAGPNGSGKTTITDQGLAHQWFGGCEYINPDLVARDEFGDWNDPAVVLKAAAEAEKRRKRALSERRSIAMESVFSSSEKVDFLRAAQRSGYFIRVFFVATSDPSINAARVARRVTEGGHDVPIPKIITRYFKSLANCAAIAREVDRLYVYDNSVDAREPQLVFRALEGRLLKSYISHPPWTASIARELQNDE